LFFAVAISLNSQTDFGSQMSHSISICSLWNIMQ
jgi:hypothetical protein